MVSRKSEEKQQAGKTDELCGKKLFGKLCEHSHKRPKHFGLSVYKQPFVGQQLFNIGEQEDVRPLSSHDCTKYQL